jgi:hypothetical protein
MAHSTVPLNSEFVFLNLQGLYILVDKTQMKAKNGTPRMAASLHVPVQAAWNLQRGFRLPQRTLFEGPVYRVTDRF